MKRRKCKQCKEVFEQQRPLQYLCGVACSVKYAKKLQEKKEKKEHLELKKSLLTHKDYLKILQTIFNTYIRLRDKDKPCISCGAYKAEEFHAGHYIASTYSYLRFNELNVHKQCSRCNTHLRGNLIPYRIELINRMGLKSVEGLENDRHRDLKLTIPEIQEMIKVYKSKINSLRLGRAVN